jgi:nitrous oxidase accessory protein NosD
LRNGSQALVQNLRLFNDSFGVSVINATSSTVQNCFIVGLGPSTANTVGVYLDGDQGLVVKNNQIGNELSGGISGNGNGSIFIANQLDELRYWFADGCTG